MTAFELTEAAEAWLLSLHPEATIVRELSVSDWGGALIDIAAITDEEIIGVEIKGEGDSPTRLELQGLKYGQVVKKMWLLVTPEGTLSERCDKKKPKGWGKLAINPRNGVVSPAIRYKSELGNHVEHWQASESQSLNPWAMCGTLWRDELHDLCVQKNLKPHRRERVAELTSRVVQNMTVPAIHDAMIEQLRGRVWKRQVIDNRPKSEPLVMGLF